MLIALRFYATGSFQVVVGDLMNISQSSVCRVIKNVSRCIASAKNGYNIFPTDQNDIAGVNRKFYEISNIPGIIGGLNALQYINRKGWYSINCKVVCNFEMKITNIVARWYGSAHDSRIFHESSLKEHFDNEDYHGILLGDAGYPSLKYLLTPVNNPQTPGERAYNYHHNKGRTVIEMLFGVWKRRFACLSFGLRLKIDTCLAAMLQNIANILQEQEYLEDDPIEQPDALPEDMYAGIPNNRGNALRRRIIQNYFENGN